MVTHQINDYSEVEARIQQAIETSATELDLSGFGLVELPESLKELRSLRTLNASFNRLNSLPESLSELRQLETLLLGFNRLTSLPDSLGSLKHLQTLAVWQNELTDLPDSVCQLTELRALLAFSNYLTTLPKAFGGLIQLERLYLHHNQLADLPESVLRLSSLREISLYENESLGIPVEIVGRGLTWPSTPSSEDKHSASLILDYYFRTRRGFRRLNEAKLILVGRGGVGKTSLVKCLTGDTFDAHEAETPGINIRPWEITVTDGDRVRLHIWDLGGQRILHGTHQFFLTERTLYLLVLSGREDSTTQDAEYWLQLIRSFGTNSKVLIALNKSRQHPFDVNRGLLVEKYPFISDFVKTDCKGPALGLDELRLSILRETDALEHRKAAFPSDWFAIKERLAGMTENFLTWEEYQEICRDLGEGDPSAQRHLANFLHILGIALNYRDDLRLRETHVLNPSWVTEGIYALLRAGQSRTIGGVFGMQDVRDALDEDRYPVSCHDFLVHLMEKFKLCFRLPIRPDRPTCWLMPEALSENQPANLNEFLSPPGLTFRYEYEVLPEGLLPRFIVQTQSYSEAHPNLRWRTGVVLEREGARAVVRADIRELRVDIVITGAQNQRRSLLAVIRDKFDEQHRELKGLPVDERVPVPGEPDLTVSYFDLVKRETRGETKFFPENSDSLAVIGDLLNGIESTEERQRRKAARAQMAGEHSSTFDAKDPSSSNESENTRIKTVLELDLKGYSDVARELEEHFTAELVMQFNEQIQGFIDIGLEASGLSRAGVVMATTGDGAILLFDAPSLAHSCAHAVHEACRVHNSRKSISSAKRWFRIGIATGEVAARGAGSARAMAGSVIARAVRLEAASGIGEIVADVATYAALTDSQQACYGEEEDIVGKRTEKFRARRYVVIPGLNSTVQTESISISSGRAAALKKWQERLNYFEEQLAIASSPAHKFEIKCHIEEAKGKIAELGA